MTGRSKPTQDGVVLAGPCLVPKNAREALRLSIDVYLGHKLLSCRIWYKPDGSEDLRPGTGGWAVAVDRLPDVITALQQLEAEARRLGLLP